MAKSLCDLSIVRDVALQITSEKRVPLIMLGNEVVVHNPTTKG